MALCTLSIIINRNVVDLFLHLKYKRLGQFICKIIQNTISSQANMRNSKVIFPWAKRMRKGIKENI